MWSNEFLNFEVNIAWIPVIWPIKRSALSQIDLNWEQVLNLKTDANSVGFGFLFSFSLSLFNVTIFEFQISRFLHWMFVHFKISTHKTTCFSWTKPMTIYRIIIYVYTYMLSFQPQVFYICSFFFPLLFVSSLKLPLLGGILWKNNEQRVKKKEKN